MPPTQGVGESPTQCLTPGSANKLNGYLPFVRCTLGGGRREKVKTRCPQGLRKPPVYYPPVEEGLPSQALTVGGNLALRHRRSDESKGHSPGE